MRTSAFLMLLLSAAVALDGGYPQRVRAAAPPGVSQRIAPDGVSAVRGQPATPVDIATRKQHTTTLLTDGRVLVVGGYDLDTHPLAGAALFDPVSLTWSTTALLDTARAYHTATRLRDGRVLVVGGFGCRDGCTVGGELSSAEIYDPTRGVWSPAAPMATARSVHGAALLPDGRVLITGGFGTDPDLTVAPSFTILRSTLRSAEIYDPDTDTWGAATPLHGRRAGANIVTLADGRIVALSGSDLATVKDSTGRVTDFRGSEFVADPLAVTNEQERAVRDFLDRGEIYDPATGDWTLMASPPDRSPYCLSSVHWVSLLRDGRIICITGYEFEQVLTYDLTADRWTAPRISGHGPHTSMPYVLPLVRLEDGRILGAGGEDTGSPHSAADTFLLDPATFTWRPTGAMTVPRQDYTAVLLADGRVLVFGGRQYERRSLSDPRPLACIGQGSSFGIARYLASSEIFDPATETWTALDPAPPIPACEDLNPLTP